jgi:hypothetical protein
MHRHGAVDLMILEADRPSAVRQIWPEGTSITTPTLRAVLAPGIRPGIPPVKNSQMKEK